MIFREPWIGWIKKRSKVGEVDWSDKERGCNDGHMEQYVKYRLTEGIYANGHWTLYWHKVEWHHSSRRTSTWWQERNLGGINSTYF